MLLALAIACAARVTVPPGVPADPPVAAPPLPDGWRDGPALPDLAITDADPSLGPADARFTVVSFADYFCPHCAAFWPRAKELLARNPDVRLVLKNYPIESECNTQVSWSGHRFACLAARAAECAAQVGVAEGMADLLFLYPDHVTPPEMPLFAEKLGLDGARFSACLADPATDAAVRADVAAGVAAGIAGTPAVFVAGLAPGWVSVAPSVEILELVLAEARAGRLGSP